MIFLFLLVAASGAGALSLTDEASFYAFPGEKPYFVELSHLNASFFLVLLNNSPGNA